jgi:RNA polymerase sigma factor (sigma-70 family)
MSDFVPRPTVARLARLVTGGPAESDAQLLGRFVTGRDEGAFRTLLDRYAPLVLGVCRRSLGQAADVDDAFQATFLVLARSASRVRKPEALGCWLYGVARKVAARLRTTQARRARLPNVAVRTVEPADAAAAWRDLQAVLDDELGRLPAKYRDPFVLCCLNDLTHEAAAARLGLPVGTIKSRLTRARDRLRTRLARRGLAPAATGVALTVLAGPAAAVPNALLESTMTIICRGGPRTAAVALADEVLRGALRTKIVAGLAAVAVALGVTLAAGPGRTPTPPPVAPPAATAAEAVDALGDPLPAGARARLGSLRLRHMHTIRSVAFTTAGDSVITRSWDGTTRVFDLTTGKEVRRVSFPYLTSAKDDPGNLVWAVIAPDGRTGLSFHKDGSFRFSDLQTGAVRKQHTVAQFEAPSAFVPGAFTPDGKTVATYGQGVVRLWDVKTGDETKSFTIPRAGDLVLSPDGKTLAVVTQQAKTATKAEPGEVVLWDVATGKELQMLTGYGDKIYQAAFSPDGKRLAAGGGIQDRTVRVWDVATGKELVRIPGPEGWVRPVAFSPDGKTLAVGGQNGIIVLLDPDTGKEVGQLRIPGQDDVYGPWVMSVAFAPDGKRLISVGTEKAIRVWDLAMRKEVPGAVTGHQNEVRGVAVSPDGRTAYSAGSDSAVIVWDLATGRETARWTRHQDGIAALALSANGKTLVTAGKTVVVWDLAQGRPARELVGHTKTVGHVAVSADGKTIATGCDGDHTARLWDAATGRLLHTIVPPSPRNYGILPVAIAAGGSVLVTGSGDYGDRGTYVWDVATGRQLRRFEHPAEHLQTSPDGRTVVVVRGDSETALIDPLSSADPLKVPRVGGGSAAFSPDGRTLAVGKGDGTAVLVETETGFERGRCAGHLSGQHGRSTFAAGVACLAFTPDGRTLLTGGGDTTLLVWDVAAISRPAEGPAVGRADWWPALAAEPDRAHRALKEMLANPADAVAELKARLTPVSAPDAGRIAALVKGLEADRFADRERASAGLVALGDGATPAVRTAREATTSAEVRERLDAALAKIAQAESGLRVRRAIECLERIRTPDAKAVLAAVAAGAPGAVRTDVAGAALRRVERFP